MARIAVFDSGLGSLSVVRQIRRRLRCELVYVADRASYPYGTKRSARLCRIVSETAAAIRDRFDPDLVIAGSNTPSLACTLPRGVAGVLPPVSEAARLSRTGRIAVLATRSAIRSGALARHISSQGTGARVTRIDCSSLVDAVESGRFLWRRRETAGLVRRVLGPRLGRADVATLSSTHLPFLREYLEEEFPGVVFLDPAERLAERISRRFKDTRRGSLSVYATAGAAQLERSLGRLGIRNRVRPWDLWPCGTRG